MDNSPVNPALALALAWQPPSTRPALAALFSLDARLSAQIERASEPMLAQIRLSWWRDRLGAGDGDREPLLAKIADNWLGDRAGLLALVDGWEATIGVDANSAALAIGEARARALEEFARAAGCADEVAACGEAGRRWTTAQFLDRVPEETPPLARLSAGLRGIAVLGALATHAIRRGQPILDGRRAALVALRVGMFGR